MAALALAVPMSIANAQKSEFDFVGKASQNNSDAAYLQGFAAGSGVSGTAMTQDDKFLYIVQGSNIYKANKSDMSFVTVGYLPPVHRVHFSESSVKSSEEE